MQQPERHSPTRRPDDGGGDRGPRHPTWPTVWLLVGTTVLIVLLALGSAFGWL